GRRLQRGLEIEGLADVVGPQAQRHLGDVGHGRDALDVDLAEDGDVGEDLLELAGEPVANVGGEAEPGEGGDLVDLGGAQAMGHQGEGSAMAPVSRRAIRRYRPPVAGPWLVRTRAAW